MLNIFVKKVLKIVHYYLLLLICLCQAVDVCMLIQVDRNVPTFYLIVEKWESILVPHKTKGIKILLWLCSFVFITESQNNDQSVNKAVQALDSQR